MAGQRNGKHTSAIKITRMISAIAAGEAIESIAKRLHASNHSVIACREREWQEVARRKELILAQASQVAMKSLNEMNHRLASPAKLPANILGVWAGISVDKIVALSPTNDPQTQQHLHLHVQAQDLFNSFNRSAAPTLQNHDNNDNSVIHDSPVMNAETHLIGDGKEPGKEPAQSRDAGLASE